MDALCLCTGAMRNEAYVEKANGFGGKVQRTFSGAPGNTLLVPASGRLAGRCLACDMMAYGMWLVACGTWSLPQATWRACVMRQAMCHAVPRACRTADALDGSVAAEL